MKTAAHGARANRPGLDKRWKVQSVEGGRWVTGHQDSWFLPSPQEKAKLRETLYSTIAELEIQQKTMNIGIKMLSIKSLRSLKSAISSVEGEY